MDIYDAIYGRQSVRSFDSTKDVPQELVEKLLQAAVQAPSAGNVQPWRFVVVRDKQLKEGLVDAAFGQDFIAEAPVAVVVCADLEASSYSYGRRGSELYVIQDTAAAIENLLLAAYAEGLGTCWVGAFNEQTCASVLNLPKNIRPVAIVPVGYPRHVGKKPSKTNPQELTDFR